MVSKEMLNLELMAILKSNAPVRDGVKYPGKRGDSPYPGNLKNNGIRPNINADSVIIEIGYPDAPYAPYTETRSRKKGWQKKSNQQFLAKLQKLGEVKNE